MTDWNDYGTAGNACNSYWPGAGRTLQELGDDIASKFMTKFGIASTIVLSAPQLGTDIAAGIKSGDYSAAVNDGQNLAISIAGSYSGEYVLGALGFAVGGPVGGVIGAVTGAFPGAEYINDLIQFLKNTQWTQKKWEMDWNATGRAGELNPYQRMDPEYGNVHGQYRRRAGKLAVGQHHAAPAAHRPERQIHMDWYWTPNPVDEAFVKPEREESAAVPIHVWKGVLWGTATGDLAPISKLITAPIMIFWGDQDALFNADHQQRLKAAFPNARYETFKGAGHNMFWEQPQRAAALIEAFLSP